MSRLYPKHEAGAIAGELFHRILHLNAVQRVLQGEAGLTEKQRLLLNEALRELLTGKPVQYVTGICSFLDMELFITPGVLIPRPETEELVLWVIEEMKQGQDARNKSILDIGTGSGCIAIALAKRFPACAVSACDVSEAALELAGRNARANNAMVNFFRCDILAEPDNPKNSPAVNPPNIPATNPATNPFFNLSDNPANNPADNPADTPNKRISVPVYDCIVSNPPYVRQSERALMHLNVLEHEPHTALFVPDEDPLLYYRAICKWARHRLKPGGMLFFEINENLGRETASLVEDLGFTRVKLRNDIHGRQRFLKASQS